MRFTNTHSAYGAVTRVLHWLVAALTLALIGIGYWMVGLGYYDRWYRDALELHKSLGMLALALGAAMVVWALGNRRVRRLDSLSASERTVAAVVHHLLYLAMVAVPATGYVVSTSAGKGIDVFGLFVVPAIAPIGDVTRDLAIALHYWLAYGVGVLALGHAAVAVKHELVDRDGTLRRMLW